MEGFWRQVGRFLSARTAIVLGIVALVTVALGAAVSGLDFATGQDSYIEPDSEVAIENRQYQELFGGELMVVLLTMDEGRDVADLITPANVAELEEIQGELADTGLFTSVITPVTLLQWSENLATTGIGTNVLASAAARETDPAKKAIRDEDLALTTARVAAAGAPGLDNPAWVDFLVYDNVGFELSDGAVVAPPDAERAIRRSLRAFIPDGAHALVGGVVEGNASLDELAAASAAVQEVMEGRELDGASFIVTGVPTFLTDINNYLQGGMLTLGAIAVGVMVIILLVAFRVRWRLLPLAAMLTGIVWGFGAFALTGTDLSLVTISGLPILIGIGIEFAIQVHNRVEEECVLDREADPFGETMARLGPPLAVATIAAVVAFMAMQVSRVPMIRDFGILLSIGIVALLLTGIAVPLAVLGARERRSPTTTPAPTGIIERFIHWLGSLPAAAVIPLIIAALAIPVAGLLLEDDTPIESDPINWADPQTETIRNARSLENETGYATTLGIFLETDGADENGIFTDQMAAFTHDLVLRSMADNPELAAASSLTTTLSDLIAIPGTTAFAPTAADMLAAYEVAPPDLQRLLVADGGNAAQVVYQVGPSSLEQRAVVVDNLNQTIAAPGDDAPLPSNADATPAGLALVGVGLLENLTTNRSVLTLLAVLLVAAWLLLRYGDLARATVTMIPVLFAVGVSALLVSVLGITLSPLTTVSGPLVVATCAEFAILLVARYAEERDRGLSPEEGTHVAEQRTGRAFFTSALTTLGGFAVLMFSSLPLLRDFGMVVTLNIAVAVLSALVVVPPVVRFADHHGWLRIGAPEEARAGGRWAIAGVAAAALVALGVGLIITATDEGAEALPAVQTVPATDPIATLPPPTTAPAPPSTAEPGGTLPPGPAERPTGLVGGAFFDGLTTAGVNPGVARCAADNLLAKKTEPELLTMGIAQTPRPAEVDALLTEAATECGVTPEQLAAASG